MQHKLLEILSCAISETKLTLEVVKETNRITKFLLAVK